MNQCDHYNQVNTAGRWICKTCGVVVKTERFIKDLSSVRVSPSAKPSRRNNIPPRTPNNSFEKGNRLDDRGIPYLDKSGSPLKMKEPYRPEWYGRERITIHTGSR